MIIISKLNILPFTRYNILLEKKKNAFSIKSKLDLDV